MMAMQSRQYGARGGHPGAPTEQLPASSELQEILKTVALAEPQPELFDDVARRISEILRPQGAGRRDPNKRSQIRRFYDEMLRFESELRRANDETFAKRLPFLKMLNARAAYAAERKAEGGTLVDRNFTAFLKALLDQVEDPRTLRNACTLFEAVIGFSPRDN
jgi:CRISPR-associated protein Csm2